MADYERGRHHSHRDYNDEYVYRPRRHRSLGRQALDKLEDAIGSLSINDRDRGRSHHSPSHNHHHSSVTKRRHSRDYDVEHDRHHRPRGRSRHYHHYDSYHHHGHYDDRDHHHHSNRRRPYSSSPTRRSRRDHSVVSRQTTESSRARSRSRVDRAFKAGVDAAVIETFRLRNEPGSWRGKKGMRIATAAAIATAVGAGSEKRKQEGGHTKLGPMGSAVAGLAVNRLVNGPRKELR